MLKKPWEMTKSEWEEATRFIRLAAKSRDHEMEAHFRTEFKKAYGYEAGPLKHAAHLAEAILDDVYIPIEVLRSHRQKRAQKEIGPSQKVDEVVRKRQEQTALEERDVLPIYGGMQIGFCR